MTHVAEEGGRHLPHRTDLSGVVQERCVAFSRPVEFKDPRKAETIAELLPDVGAQPVADGDLDAMLAVVVTRRLVQQIAAELTDVLERRRVVASDVVPEPAGLNRRRIAIAAPDVHAPPSAITPPAE